MGHFLTAKTLNWKVDKIYFYPYGGFTKFNDDLNKSKKEELLVMLMGPIFQICYFLVVSPFLTISELEIFANYHYSILLFNMLPIYPLDGGKLLNIVLNFFVSFRQSFKLTIFISYIVFFVFTATMFIIKGSLSLSLILIIILLVCKLTEEGKKEKYYFNKFLLERYLNDYNFSKIKVVKGINWMFRDYKHVFFRNGKTCSEKEELICRFRQ